MELKALLTVFAAVFIAGLAIKAGDGPVLGVLLAAGDAAAGPSDWGEDIAVPADIDVVEIAGGEQAARRGPHGLLVYHVTDRHGQCGKYGSRGDALQSLDTNVGYDERIG